MKKNILITLLILVISLFAKAQVYQLPNPGFENWDGNGANDEPTNWNGFPSAECNIAIGCNIATKTRHARSTDVRNGATGTYSCKIFSTSALGITANGNITTGQIRVGSTTAANSGNYNITRRANPNFSQPFNAKPDSIRFWAKFQCANNSQEARMSATIHSDYDYRDPSASDSNAENYVVGKAIVNFPQGNRDWNQYTVPFDYINYPASEQAYILLTFTTNKNPGGGDVNDMLFIDDIEMIYNVNLRDLQVNGVSIPDFNPEIMEYNLEVPCNSNNNVSAITMSSNASLNITQGSITNPVATITVSSGDQTKHYKINYRYRAFRYIDEKICQGEAYSNNGFNLPAQNENGFFVHDKFISSVNGCDSILRLRLTVNPTYNSAVPHELMICTNSSYNFFGRILTEAGRYDTVVNTVNGCDSLVILNLKVGDRFETNLASTICEGTIYNNNGFKESEEGIYFKKYTSTSGCDSIVTLTLTVNPSFETEIYDTIFSGAYYNKHGFTINETDSIGNFTFRQDSSTILGCDSIITLNLTVKKYEVEMPPTNPDFYFEIYPNPTSDSFTIYIEDYKADDLKYFLYNSQGRLMSSGNIIGNHFKVNVGEYRSGVYILKIFLSEEIYKTSKIMVN